MPWIFLLIIITIAVASAIASVVKNQQEKDETAPRRRSTARSGDGVKTGNSDMDRFLQEIEKLRKKSADGGEERSKPAAKPARAASVPTVTAKKPQKRDVPTVAAKPRVDRLPAARVIAEPPPPPQFTAPTPGITESPPMVIPSAPASPILSQRGVTQQARSPFADKLTGLLKDKNNMAMVFTLQEIFGPPKSKQS